MGDWQHACILWGWSSTRFPRAYCVMPDASCVIRRRTSLSVLPRINREDPLCRVPLHLTCANESSLISHGEFTFWPLRDAIIRLNSESILSGKYRNERFECQTKSLFEIFKRSNFKITFIVS